MHADCCCSHINRDRPYPSKQFKGRSFRGDNPIPVHKNDKPVPQSTQKLEKENDESFTDDADSDSYDPSKSPEEDYEALPSYGEAIAQAQGKSQ